MNRMKHILCLLLAALMILPLAACGEAAQGSPADTTAAGTAAAASAETTAAEEEPFDPNDRSSAKSSLDPSLDFGGTVINVGYVASAKYQTDILGDQDGDVINEAIYYRNLSVEETLNVKLNPIDMGSTTNDAASKFTSVVLSGDDVYDTVTGHQSYLSKQLFDGLFQNMADDPYIDWEQPWWAYDYMKEFTIGDDQLYFLFGDICLMMLKSAGSVYFNKTLFNEYFEPSDNLYQLVMDGGWTMDRLHNYSSGAYKDLNGDGEANDGDLFGVTATTVKSVEHFQYDAGIRTTARDADGIPYFILNNERTALFAEKLYKLYYENPGAIIYTSDSSIDKEMNTMFKDDHLLFYPAWFYSSELLRDMETDFGIIPYPKLDEAQSEYMTLVHNGSTMFCVPVTITSEKLAIIGAVLEDMAFESYKQVTPAYFEVAMKEKYSRDNISSQILDMLYESTYTDFGYCYSSTLNSIGMLRQLAANKTADFASWYASKEAGAIEALNKLIDLYLENN